MIDLSRGVCGNAAQKKESIVVEDVSLFPGHIACSSLSRSELVVPIIMNDELYGVIDLDSPVLSRFALSDKILVERIAKLVSSLN